MRKFVRISLVAALILAAWTACQRASEDKAVVLTTAEVDSLRTVYQSLNDSIDARWSVLEADEEQKLANLNRLLMEISFTPTFSQVRYDSLKHQLEQFQNLRLAPESMTDEQIDRYDAALNSLQSAIIRMAMDNEAFEQYPLMGELIDSINASDQRVLFYRVQYDNYVSDMNQFLDVHNEQLPVIDTFYTPKKRKLFRLEETE